MPTESDRAVGTAEEARYRRFFETAQDGILILNAATGQIIDANPLLMEGLGYSREHLVGKQLWDLGPFQDIVRDITEPAQADAVIQELEAFSYSVSHDLRAPLRHIEGYSKQLLEGHAGQLDSQGRHCIERIQAGTQRMGQLIADLLSLSHMTQVEMTTETVNLSALAQAIVADLRKSAPSRQVECVVMPAVVATGDPGLLGVALENLLSNAWKYTSKHPRARIEFGATERAGRLVYFVRDDGAGFDMAHAGKLFGAFQRLHGAAQFEGTGIGLATVQRIIHRHGGRVWAEAAAERGATISFTLGPPSKARASMCTAPRVEPRA